MVDTARSLAMTWNVHDPLVPEESCKLNRMVIVSPEFPLEFTSELEKSSFTLTGLKVSLNRSKNSGTEKVLVVAGETSGVGQVKLGGEMTLGYEKDTMSGLKPRVFVQLTSIRSMNRSFPALFTMSQLRSLFFVPPMVPVVGLRFGLAGEIWQARTELTTRVCVRKFTQPLLFSTSMNTV